MNETKWKLLELMKTPTTIKDLQEKSGLKWANLSLHLKDLDEEGFIITLGKQGKSRVIQINQFKVNNYLAGEQSRLHQIMENFER